MTHPHPYSPYKHARLDESLLEPPSVTDPSSPTSLEFTKILAELFSYPAAALNRPRPSGSKRVCVIGGGIAGLAAAYELATRGHQVTLLEASSRLGGRIWTHRFKDGSYGELGAMRIPELHSCVRHYVRTFGMEERERVFVSRNDNAFLSLRGSRPVRQSDWQSLLSLFTLDQQMADRGVSPFGMLEEAVDAFAPLWTLPNLRAIFQDFVIPSGFEALERLTLGQVMRGSPPPFPGALKFSDEGWEFIGRATGSIWLERASALQFFVNELALKAPKKFELSGGMDSLVAAFEDRLANLPSARMLLNSPATDVALDEECEVTWSSAEGPKSEAFQYVICAVPAAPALRIAFTPPLSPGKLEALTNISYSSAAKTIVRCRGRFWETIDSIFGGGTYTDLPNQQCWYPSDNAVEVAAELAPPNIGPTGSGQSQEVTWAARSPAARRGVFTAAYMWEANARRFACLSTEERTALIVGCLEKLHGKNVTSYINDPSEDIVHCAWDNYSRTGGGAWAFFGPGEQRRYQAALCEPHRAASRLPKVFFAGEHLAIAHAWIQSAIQSALGAAIEVLDSP